MHGLFEKFADVLSQSLGDVGPVQVLDVAAASGEPALSIALALPEARLISTDLGESFAELGRARAEQAGVAGRMEFETADAEDLHQFQDCSMDAVTCSLGLMLFPNYPKALAEFHLVLKPGGVLAVTVWHSLQRIPFMRMLRDFCQGEELEPGAAAAPCAAGKFGDSAQELLDTLRQAGFQQVVREDLDLTFVLPADVWWEAMQHIPFPISKLLARIREQGPPGALNEAKERLRHMMEERGYVTPAGSIRVCGNMCHFITARK